MIVTGTGTPTRALGPAGAAAPTWRCLARRGMLHSECETFDHVVLPPGRTGRHDDPGVEQAVHVLRGTAELRLGGTARRLDADDVVLVPAGTAALVEAGPDGAELLVLRVLSKASHTALPPRVPELPPRERAIGNPAPGPHQERAA
ncbi:MULTISPECIES: cupin domain-containing protein [unclassified Streptomyces]|uniref:cupin domain-containing protein n=1 Tax=unclassified Streptomyces TaxID=2593676 RepID=UPI0033321214